MSRPFVLVDRDGTINVERHHLAGPDQVELVPGSAAALRRLHDEGFGIVIVTNQAQVGRGLLEPATLERINERLVALLGDEGACIDAIFVCPHDPAERCRCRKPAPGLAIDAAAALGFDLTTSFVVGDHASDMGMGRAIGATTLLVLTGHGENERERAAALADHVVTDLGAAVAIIAGLAGKG